MSSFRDAVIATPDTKTTNGMAAFSSTHDYCLDLFGQIGSARQTNILPLFQNAFLQDTKLALRILLHARDIREGSGERDTPRKIYRWLAENYPAVLVGILPHIPYFGRWDDLLVFDGLGELETLALDMFAQGFEDPEVNALVAKWAPKVASTSPSSRRKKRKNGDVVIRAAKAVSEYRKGRNQQAYKLRKYMGLDERSYRALCKHLSTAVEQQMCAGEWDKIDFSKIPSVASSRYQKAFGRHAGPQYTAYKEALKAGTAKVNASAIYPYDVLRALVKGDNEVAKAQWSALPNFLGDDGILPMVDVSGSMSMAWASPGLTCLDVAVGLGLYIADKQTGAFKDMFLSFSSDPQLEVLRGDINQKIVQMQQSHWQMSTNLEAALVKVLGVGVDNNLSSADMPKMLLILSDMQFNRCVTNVSRGDMSYRARVGLADKENPSAMAAIRNLYSDAGYQMPRIVFWTLNSAFKNVPISHTEDGAALVSGFSPNLMKSLLKAEDFTPLGVMRSTVNVPRYINVTGM